MHTEPVEFNKQFINTTVGRAILNDALPEGMPFINGLLKKKGIGQLVNYCYLNLGLEVTVKMLDRIKELGFHLRDASGLSVGLDDMVIPARSTPLVRDAEKR
jgi:DNA-directed RNA polymerase subunit beta'